MSAHAGAHAVHGAHPPTAHRSSRVDAPTLGMLLFMTIRAFRGHFSPEHHHGVEIGGIYWHFVDVMWIVVYTTVYII